MLNQSVGTWSNLQWPCWHFLWHKRPSHAEFVLAFIETWPHHQNSHRDWETRLGWNEEWDVVLRAHTRWSPKIDVSATKTGSVTTYMYDWLTTCQMALSTKLDKDNLPVTKNIVFTLTMPRWKGLSEGYVGLGIPLNKGCYYRATHRYIIPPFFRSSCVWFGGGYQMCVLGFVPLWVRAYPFEITISKEANKLFEFPHVVVAQSYLTQTLWKTVQFSNIGYINIIIINKVTSTG